MALPNNAAGVGNLAYGQRVTGIQRRAAICIGRAFKSTSAAGLNIELHLLPNRLQIERIIQETVIRIQAGPKWAQPDCLGC